MRTPLFALLVAKDASNAQLQRSVRNVYLSFGLMVLYVLSVLHHFLDVIDVLPRAYASSVVSVFTLQVTTVYLAFQLYKVVWHATVLLAAFRARMVTI
jgi:hypothetical protein